MQTKRFQQDFFKRLRDGQSLAPLFDHLPEIYFYVKNEQSQFVMGNGAFYEMLGVMRDDEVAGKKDHDFFDPEIADRYVEEDQQVMRTHRPSANEVWLVPDRAGKLAWYVSTKIPLFSRTGKAIGIAGTLRDFERAGSVLEPYREMSPVISYIMEQYPERIETPALAELVHLSVSQFHRKFKRVFHMVPAEYIARVRVNAARRTLVDSKSTISQIAQQTGFYDHSHFAKQFKRYLGMTPAEYRNNAI